MSCWFISDDKEEKCRRAEALRILCELGADVNHKSDSESKIVFGAVRLDSVDTLELLINHGASLQDPDGRMLGQLTAALSFFIDGSTSKQYLLFKYIMDNNLLNNTVRYNTLLSKFRNSRSSPNLLDQTVNFLNRINVVLDKLYRFDFELYAADILVGEVTKTFAGFPHEMHLEIGRQLLVAELGFPITQKDFDKLNQSYEISKKIRQSHKTIDEIQIQRQTCLANNSIFARNDTAPRTSPSNHHSMPLGQLYNA